MHKVISDHDTSVSKNRGIPKWMIYNGKPYYISDHDTVDSRSSTKISLALMDGFFAMYIPNTHGLWHGAILQPRKMCLKKVVLFNFRNPPTKDVFFSLFQKEDTTTAHLTAGSWRQVFFGYFCCAHGSFGTQRACVFVVFLHRWNQRKSTVNPVIFQQVVKEVEFPGQTLPSLKLTAKAPEIFDPLEVRGSRTWKPSFFLVVRTVSFRKGS